MVRAGVGTPDRGGAASDYELLIMNYEAQHFPIREDFHPDEIGCFLPNVFSEL